MNIKKLLLAFPLFFASIAFGMDKNIYSPTKIYQPASLKSQAALKVPNNHIKKLSRELSTYVLEHKSFNFNIQAAKQAAIDQLEAVKQAAIYQTYIKEIERICSIGHDTTRLEELYTVRPHIFTQNNDLALALRICVAKNNISGARWLLEKVPLLAKAYSCSSSVESPECYLLQALLVEAAMNHQNDMAVLLYEFTPEVLLHELFVRCYAGRWEKLKCPYLFCTHLTQKCVSANNFEMLYILFKKFPLMDLGPALRTALETNNNAAYLHLLPYVEKELRSPEKNSWAGSCYRVLDSFINSPVASILIPQIETLFKNETIKNALQPAIINRLQNTIRYECYHEGKTPTPYITFLISLVTPAYQAQLSTILNSCLQEICAEKCIWSIEILRGLKFILNSGANPLTQDSNGKIPLQLLLEKPSRDLITPPIEVFGFGRHWHSGDLRKVVKSLLKSDGTKQVTHIDPQGNTALHTASASLVIDQLLDHGGNINLRNNNGETPSLIFVKENIKDWGRALNFYGDGHRDYDGQCMKSDLHEFSERADHTIPDFQGNTVLGHLSSLKTNAVNKYFAQTVINLFKQSKKRVQWQYHTSKAITNATFKALARKKTIEIPLDFSNNLAAAQAFRDNKGNFIPAPKAQMEDVD